MRVATPETGNRKLNVRSDNFRVENWDIDWLLFLLFSVRFAWPFLQSLVINLWNVMKNIIYFAVNKEGSNKSDYFPNPQERFPWRFNVF